MVAASMHCQSFGHEPPLTTPTVHALAGLKRLWGIKIASLLQLGQDPQAGDDWELPRKALNQLGTYEKPSARGEKGVAGWVVHLSWQRG